MTVTRRTLLATLGLAPVAAALLPRTALAAYPERVIHFVVPFAPGGNADVTGRIIADVVSKQLKQSAIVDNRAGAGGGVGAQVVARAQPDGYTLMVGSNGPLTINPIMHVNPGYDTLKDFAPVALATYVPHALIMANRFEAKTIPELIAASKKKSVSIATSGVGSATHMTLERFKAATGADITHVPYRGGGAMVPDLMAGNVDGSMTELSTAFELHKDGKARLLAVAATHRSKLAPDIQTFIEGGVKGFTAESYIGVLAPAKTPADVIAKLQKAIVDGLKTGDAADRLRGLGSEIATPEQMTPQGFAAFIKTDFENMQAAAKLAGITPQ